jgi:hypothetical protein
MKIKTGTAGYYVTFILKTERLSIRKLWKKAMQMLTEGIRFQSWMSSSKPKTMLENTAEVYGGVLKV